MTYIIQAISHENGQIVSQTKTDDKQTMDTVRKQYLAQGLRTVVRVEG